MLPSAGSLDTLRQCCSVRTLTHRHQLARTQMCIMHNMGKKKYRKLEVTRDWKIYSRVYRDPESQKKWQGKKKRGKYLAVLKYSLHKRFFTKTITLSSKELTLHIDLRATVVIKKLMKHNIQSSGVKITFTPDSLRNKKNKPQQILAHTWRPL